MCIRDSEYTEAQKKEIRAGVKDGLEGQMVADDLNVDIEDVLAALDEEESSRIELQLSLIHILAPSTCGFTQQIPLTISSTFTPACDASISLSISTLSVRELILTCLLYTSRCV